MASALPPPVPSLPSHLDMSPPPVPSSDRPTLPSIITQRSPSRGSAESSSSGPSSVSRSSAAAGASSMPRPRSSSDVRLPPIASFLAGSMGQQAGPSTLPQGPPRSSGLSMLIGSEGGARGRLSGPDSHPPPVRRIAPRRPRSSEEAGNVRSSWASGAPSAWPGGIAAAPSPSGYTGRSPDLRSSFSGRASPSQAGTSPQGPWAGDSAPSLPRLGPNASGSSAYHTLRTLSPPTSYPSLPAGSLSPSEAGPARRRWSGSTPLHSAPYPRLSPNSASREVRQRRNTDSSYEHGRGEAQLAHLLHQVRSANAQCGLVLPGSPSPSDDEHSLVSALRGELLRLRVYDAPSAARLAADAGLSLDDSLAPYESSSHAGSSRASPPSPMSPELSAPAGLVGSMDVDMADGSLPRKLKPKHAPRRVRKRENEHHQACLGCDAAETPEWRKGPMGNRTLCNACGLLYAKQIRRKTKEASAAGGPARPAAAETEEDKRASLEELRAAVRARSSSSASTTTAPPPPPSAFLQRMSAGPRMRDETIDNSPMRVLLADDTAARVEAPRAPHPYADMPHARAGLPPLSSFFSDPKGAPGERALPPLPHEHAAQRLPPFAAGQRAVWSTARPPHDRTPSPPQ